MMTSKKSAVVHPFLIGIYPLLYLYQNNTEEVALADIFLPMAVILISSVLVFFLFQRLLGTAAKAGVILTASLILFFSYGHVFGLVSGFRVGDVILGRDRNLLLLYGFFFIVCLVWVIKKMREGVELTRYLNLVSSFLVAFAVIGIATQQPKSNPENSKEISLKTWNLTPQVKEGQPKPDIYYFIFDTYARDDILRDSLGYDNGDFISYLKDKGFYVAGKSRANYAITPLSLVSSLNMDHFTFLKDVLGEDEDDLKYVYGIIEDNRVVKFLKSLGYRYLHFSSGWLATIKNKNADENIETGVSYSAFTDYLIKSTLIQPVSAFLFGLNHKHRTRILNNFDRMEQIPEMEGPTFMFAHMMIPHVPYVFDRDGNDPNYKMNYEKIKKDSTRADSLYIEQIMYVNKRVKRLVDIILSKSDTPPIIILQSDTGHAKSMYSEEGLKNWMKPSPQYLQEWMAILNAYYLPEGGQSGLYESITPVNSFRYIFDRYFGTDLGLLPDDSYFSNGYEKPYNFMRVPDSLN